MPVFFGVADFAGRAVWPSAAAILDIARHDFAAGNTIRALDALPNYLRDQVTQSG